MSMFHGKYLLLRHWWCGWVILGVISWVGHTTTTTPRPTISGTTTPTITSPRITCSTASGIDHLAFVHDTLQRAPVRESVRSNETVRCLLVEGCVVQSMRI